MLHNGAKWFAFLCKEERGNMCTAILNALSNEKFIDPSLFRFIPVWRASITRTAARGCDSIIGRHHSIEDGYGTADG